MATQQNDFHQIDSTVLARYGIVQPAITADSHLERKLGIRCGFADSVDRSRIISLPVPFPELDDEEQFGQLVIACTQVGVEQPLSDEDSIEFTAVYFEMMSRRRREIALAKLNALFSGK
jgi:hypothetical protein